VPQGVTPSTAGAFKGNGTRAIDDKSRSAAKKAAQEFETMFTSMMLKEMRSTAGPDKLTGGGRGEEIFQSLLDQEYASAIARQGSIGLAKVIEQQLLDTMSRTSNAAGVNASSPGPSPKED
jgi:flagellar protein FlgJ